ncbi:MAG: hypothetical protein AB7O69_06150 [Burkholderiales bacterium]
MHLLRKLLSGLLQLIAMSVLLLGSCVGPGVLYVQSPKWFLEPYDAEKSRMFFVAFQAKNDQGKENLYTVLQRRDVAKAGYTDIRYQLPAGEHREERDDTEPPASITVVNEPGGSQLVKVYVMGDSPWASLSEYRVRDNKVEPLRYGHSNALFFLIGIPLCLIGVHYLMKPIRRRIDRMVGLEKKALTPPPA